MKSYSLDGRKQISELYHTFKNLKKYGFTYSKLYTQTFLHRRKRVSLPIMSFRSQKKGKAVWIVAGIHGEESAGPNAISENIDFLGELGQKIPLVVLPLCNPKGYFKNWRHPYPATENREALSLSDCDHLLLDETGKQARFAQASNPEAGAVTDFVVEYTKSYKPLLVFDLHEDNKRTYNYIYSHGKLKGNDPVAKKILRIFVKKRMRLEKSGSTRYGELINNGIVIGGNDGSIDELFTTDKIIKNNRILKGPNAKSLIVVETVAKKFPLNRRISVHSAILKSLPEFFGLAKRI